MPFVKELDIALRAYVPAYEMVGKPLPEQITLTNINAIRAQIGLDWEPATEPQYRVRRHANGVEEVEEVKGMKYITRGIGGPILGGGRDAYELFGNGELFGIAEAVGQAAVDEGHEVKFVAGGELHGGKKVFLLADLGTVELPGDPSPHARFMTLLSGHNGGGAVKVLGTDMRWRCTNALRLAEMDAKAAGAAFSFRHTSRIAKRVEDSKKAIIAAMTQHDRLAERSAELLAKRIKPEEASAYLSRFALAQVVSKADPQREGIAAASPQRQHAVVGVERELTRIFASATCDGIRDSAYGPFAAAVEYLDHARASASPDTLFDRTMVTTERGKKLAYELAAGSLLGTKSLI